MKIENELFMLVKLIKGGIKKIEDNSKENFYINTESLKFSSFSTFQYNYIQIPSYRLTHHQIPQSITAILLQYQLLMIYYQ